ncbi:MAG TPA: efflux RND transporter periplasmic adaptor subunit [Cellvibrionaceae bacterium]
MLNARLALRLKNLWRHPGFWVAVVIVFLALLLLLWPSEPPLGNHSPQDQGHRDHSHHDHSRSNHNTPAANPASVSLPIVGDTQYTCAMHPQVRSSDPNERCPICGMALVPVMQPAAATDEKAVSLTLGPRAMALAQVRVTPVQRRALNSERRLSGRIAVDESGYKTVSARMAGRLDKLHINTTGSRVTEGEPLLEIYSPDLVSAQQELLQAIRLGEAQNQRLVREKLRLLGLASSEIDAIANNGKVRDRLVLRAPASGVVLTRHVAEGDYVSTGQTLFTLADLTRVWARLEAYETDLSPLNVGQKVSLTLAAYPGKSFTGELIFIAPVLDLPSRTAEVRVALDNPDGLLKPGLLTQARVAMDQSATLVVPDTAPLITGQRALVYVQSPEDKSQFSPREVTLGHRSEGYYSVIDGLDEGELVVTHGAFRLDSELQIRGLPSLMAPTGGSAPAHDHGGQNEQGDHIEHGGHNHD